MNDINHAVLAVGYGTDEASGLDYVLIKNSWNTTWGDKGFVKLAMSKASDGGTDKFKATGACGI